MAKKVLALNENGMMTYCTCPPDMRGKGRCNHVEHQMDDETPVEFVKRVEKKQKELSEHMLDRESFVPREGTELETKPYRMTEEEKSQLTKIENRMQLDCNIDGGYMELEEPLWNDMDKREFSNISGMSVKNMNAVLHGEAFLITESDNRRYKAGRVIPNETIDQWNSEGYPPGFENVIMDTGVLGMNEYASKMGFEPTRDVYVLPYYMRMGIGTYSEDDLEEWDETDNSIVQSTSTGETVGRPLDVPISSDITLAYKYMLRNHANPDKQQLAYEALLNNTALDRDKARYSNGYRNKSLADSFAGKGGVFRAYLSGSSIPYSARAVISPNADLTFGECAIPPSVAVDIFRPTLLDQMAREGCSIEEMDGYFKRFRGRQKDIPLEDRQDLESRLEGMRVALNRQPSLHKSSFQSFRVRISDGPTIQNHPLVCNAYNADHDGDEMTCYAFNNAKLMNPILERTIAAENEVNTTLPRHHATSTIMPNKEALWGLLNILERREK